MAKISGCSGGACHNEIFYIKDTDQTIAVEPNLRPAGMRIWDLASFAFADFDPWKEWLFWATGKGDANPKALHKIYYVGIRMIAAKFDGIITEIKNYEVFLLSNEGTEFIELVWSKKIGDHVTKNIKDNSDFIGYILAKSSDYSSLADDLLKSSMYLEQMIKIKPD